MKLHKNYSIMKIMIKNINKKINNLKVFLANKNFLMWFSHDKIN
jgi:hypothetical protein